MTINNKSIDITPKEIVAKLDQYIIGQTKAKRSVAVALRNRYRRSRLDEEMRDDIIPKNILMIGPTGVGKTEIARRLAKVVGAPFIKVEATKFTEVGYVGRDVESMVRDLVETSIRMVKEEKMENVQDLASKHANERLVQLLVPSSKKKQIKNPLEAFGLFGANDQADSTSQEEQFKQREIDMQRADVRTQLLAGKLEDSVVELEVDDSIPQMFDLFSGSGAEQMGINMQDVLGNFLPKKKKKRRLSITDARKVITQEEAQKLIDMDEVHAIAINRAEQLGIIFIDEIDKIASKEKGPDVSREGVQRDILPIVEGSTVMTKYGIVKTDYVLFIGAGAFHISKPSDLIPELQGRFPIRVELSSLTKEDFIKILTEPKNALLKQYVALLETEGIKVTFSDNAIDRIAELATLVNDTTENIGARRLHTLLEKVLEDLSFEAPDITLDEIIITHEYVDEKLHGIVKDRNMSQYIL
jgi:ATP-dependent HslUV protease ATP-binding subunit HslU